MLKNTKLITFLEKLDAAEWKNFRCLVKSPYFNTNPSLLIFADALRKFHPTYDQKNCTRAKVFQKVYGKGKIYTDDAFNSLMTQLLRLVQQFLLQEAFEKNEPCQQKLRLQLLQEKGLDDWFFREAERQRNELMLGEERDAAFHYSMYQLNQSIFSHPRVADDKSSYQALKKSVFHWQQYLIQTSLKWELIAANRKAVLTEECEISLLKAINQTEIAKKVQSPDLIFSRALIQYLEQKKEEDFAKLSAFFFRLEASFSKENKVLFFLAFLNCLIPRFRAEAVEYLPKLCKVYQMGFEKGYFLENKHLDAMLFINAVATNCKHGNFDWVSEMIEKYQDYLAEESRNDTLQYAKVLYFYLKGQREKDKILLQQSLDLFRDVQHIPERFGVQIRAILVRVHYELLNPKQIDTTHIEYFCAAFSQYLRRKFAKQEQKRTVFQVFIQDILKLLKILNATDNRNKLIEELETYLQGNPKIFARDWLIEKVREFR